MRDEVKVANTVQGAGVVPRILSNQRTRNFCQGLAALTRAQFDQTVVDELEKIFEAFAPDKQQRYAAAAECSLLPAVDRARPDLQEFKDTTYAVECLDKVLLGLANKNHPKVAAFNRVITALNNHLTGWKIGKTPLESTMKQDDMQWEDLPDYCPSVANLDHLPGGPIVTWSGSPTVLSADHCRQWLHPEEVKAAAVLRLTCEVYLANKRRAFIARVEALKASTPFTKAAMRSVWKGTNKKADVMWEAFERVGWFKQEHLPICSSWRALALPLMRLA